MDRAISEKGGNIIHKFVLTEAEIAELEAEKGKTDSYRGVGIDGKRP
jgi:hypothetical protein